MRESGQSVARSLRTSVDNDSVMRFSSVFENYYTNWYKLVPSQFHICCPQGFHFEFKPDNVRELVEMFSKTYDEVIVRNGEQCSIKEGDEITYGCYVETPICWENSFMLLFSYDDRKMVFITESIIGVLYSDPLFDAEPYLREIYKNVPFEKNKNNMGSVRLIYQTSGGGLDTIRSEVKKTNVDIKAHYNDDFLPIDEKIRKFIDCDERNSGLILLNGEPGTGKSYYIRHLINTINRNFIIITPQMASCLAMPNFTSFLMEYNDTTFILEDCEKVLLDREKYGVSDAISSLLNMSDGILSDVYACKFICTFNSGISSIDKAALRKGRCVAQYEFKKLCAEKTNSLLHELGYDVTVDKPMTLADIYTYGEDNNVKPKVTNKVGF